MPFDDITTDFRDGIRLLRLVEALTGSKLHAEARDGRVHRISNVRKALEELKKFGVETDTRPIEIVDGNMKITLGTRDSAPWHSS